MARMLTVLTTWLTLDQGFGEKQLKVVNLVGETAHVH
jgi:hypothetical protein